MRHGHHTRIAYRRRREGKTDYAKRLKILLSDKPRLIVRRTSHNIIAQIAVFGEKGDTIVCSANSRNLIKQGWTGARKNIPAAYLTGLLLAKNAQKHHISKTVLDHGLFHAVKGSRIFACLAGALDGGLEVAHSKECLPSADRISGIHIRSYAQALEAAGHAAGKTHQFTASQPLTIPDQFTSIKTKLLKGAPSPSSATDTQKSETGNK